MFAKVQILPPLLLQGGTMAASWGWGAPNVPGSFSVCYIENYAKHGYEVRKQIRTVIIRVLGGRGSVIGFKI